MVRRPVRNGKNDQIKYLRPARVGYEYERSSSVSDYLMIEGAETLSSLTVCYSSMIDRSRRCIGTRISLIAKPSTNPPSIGQVLTEFTSCFRKSAQTLLLAPFSFKYEDSLLKWDAPANVVLEVPAIILHDKDTQRLVHSLHGKGIKMAVRGKSPQGVDSEILKLFEYAVINDAEDRRKNQAVDKETASMRHMSVVIAGITNIKDADAAFMRGAKASIGWPIGQTLVQNASQLSPSQATVVRLIDLVNKHADVREIEKTLKLDPALSFKLLKFINSPAFGLPVEVTSFQHAVMLLGYAKLMRWLSLLLSSTSKDINTFPLMHASIRRGLFMEQIGAKLGENKDSLFITGAFSMLDKITYTPFEELFTMISVSQDIVDSITGKGGNGSKFLELIIAIEQSDVKKMSELMSELMLSSRDVNTALLVALSTAEEIGDVA